MRKTVWPIGGDFRISGASYVSPSSKPLGSIHPALRVGIHGGLEQACNQNVIVMNEVNQSARNKGGRPKKAICRSEQLAVMCTLIERKVIESKAKSLSISISQYLRELGLKGQAVIRSKMLPKEILLLMGTLNHMAANLNQIAKKRNRNEELNALERAQLQSLRTELAQLATAIKRHYE